MANRFSSLLKKKILGKDQNLISIEEPYDLMRRLLRGFSVTGILDAGASNGHVSERMLRNFPAAHAYAFEPSPLYKDTLEAYAKRQPRFHPQFAALSDHEGAAELNVTESAGNTSFLKPTEQLSQIDPTGATIKAKITVPVVTVDRWVRDNGNPDIQLMKLDIQGYELIALEGAVRTLQHATVAVYTEIWFNPVYEGGALFSDLDRFLREQGFVLYDIFKPRYHPTGLIQWADALFVHTGRLGM